MLRLAISFTNNELSRPHALWLKWPPTGGFEGDLNTPAQPQSTPVSSASPQSTAASAQVRGAARSRCRRAHPLPKERARASETLRSAHCAAAGAAAPVLVVVEGTPCPDPMRISGYALPPCSWRSSPSSSPSLETRRVPVAFTAYMRIMLTTKVAPVTDALPMHCATSCAVPPP